MDIFVIPIEGKFIVYRPLLKSAFVANRAMADLTLRLARQERISSAGAPEEALAFLNAIAFLRPDPPPPSPSNLACRPAMAVLLLTSRCNLRCTYCYANGGEGALHDLPLEAARSAIDYVCRNAVEQGRPRFELTFHGGGEPVQAWETLRGATSYARSQALPCHISMVSNGVWSARQRDWILHNLDNLSISFDGGAATQNRQRPFVSQRGSFRAVMRTLKALDKAKFGYGIRMTATAPWRGQLPADVRFICEETGCPAMQVEPAFNRRRGGHQGPAPEESQAFVEAFMESFEIASQAGRRLTYSGARPWVLTHTFCSAPYGAFIVDASRNVVTCYEIASQDHLLAGVSTVGRVTDGQVIVDDQARQALVTRLEEKRAGCRDCFCYWHCAGDCYTRSYAAEAGDQRGLSLRCTMNREITARLLLWYIMAGDGVWQGQDVHPQEAQLLRAF